jgi:hypothetical protein
VLSIAFGLAIGFIAAARAHAAILAPTTDDERPPIPH